MSSKATFDDLIRLKLRREERMEQLVDLPVESLGKTLQFKAPTRDEQLDFIEGVRRSGGVNGSYDAYRQLVYSCCPMLHDSELHKELGVTDPCDTVDKLFGPVEVMSIGDKLAEKFMAMGTDIKN